MSTWVTAVFGVYASVYGKRQLEKTAICSETAFILSFKVEREGEREGEMIEESRVYKR